MSHLRVVSCDKTRCAGRARADASSPRDDHKARKGASPHGTRSTQGVFMCNLRCGRQCRRTYMKFRYGAAAARSVPQLQDQSLSCKISPTVPASVTSVSDHGWVGRMHRACAEAPRASPEAYNHCGTAWQLHSYLCRCHPEPKDLIPGLCLILRLEGSSPLCQFVCRSVSNQQ